MEMKVVIVKVLGNEALKVTGALTLGDVVINELSTDWEPSKTSVTVGFSMSVNLVDIVGIAHENIPENLTVKYLESVEVNYSGCYTNASQEQAYVRVKEELLASFDKQEAIERSLLKLNKQLRSVAVLFNRNAKSWLANVLSGGSGWNKGQWFAEYADTELAALMQEEVKLSEAKRSGQNGLSGRLAEIREQIHALQIRQLDRDVKEYIGEDGLFLYEEVRGQRIA